MERFSYNLAREICISDTVQALLIAVFLFSIPRFFIQFDYDPLSMFQWGWWDTIVAIASWSFLITLWTDNKKSSTPPSQTIH